LEGRAIPPATRRGRPCRRPKPQPAPKITVAISSCGSLKKRKNTLKPVERCEMRVSVQQLRTIRADDDDVRIDYDVHSLSSWMDFRVRNSDGTGGTSNRPVAVLHFRRRSSSLMVRTAPCEVAHT